MSLTDLTKNEINNGISKFLDKLSNGLKFFKSYPNAQINIIMNTFDLIILKLMIFDNENKVEENINKLVNESFENENYHSVKKTAEILIKEFEKNDNEGCLNDF